MNPLTQPLRWAVSFGLCLLLTSPEPLAAQEDGADASAAEGRSGKARKRRGRKGRKRGSRGRTTQPAPETEAEDGATEDAEGEAAVPTGDQKLSATPQGGSLRRSNKMEFDARLVRGETAGTGAVVLFDRGQRELPPLTAERTGFLQATVAEVYDERPAQALGRAVRGKRAGSGKRGPQTPAPGGATAPEAKKKD